MNSGGGSRDISSVNVSSPEHYRDDVTITSLLCTGIGKIPIHAHTHTHTHSRGIISSRINRDTEFQPVYVS